MSRPIDASTLAARLAGARPPLVIDVRRRPAYEAAHAALPRALRCPPEAVERWGRDLRSDVPVVVYCVHGHDVSQGVAEALERLGFDAAFLRGGFEGWIEGGRPIAPKPSGSTPWVTGARPNKA